MSEDIPLFNPSRCPLWKIENDNYLWAEYVSQIGYSIGHTIIYFFLFSLSLWTLLRIMLKYMKINNIFEISEYQCHFLITTILVVITSFYLENQKFMIINGYRLLGILWCLFYPSCSRLSSSLPSSTIITV
ncbi:hypothetical protein LY90DRAFT_668712 [Neocallimastix californiae]|uniref:Uncharacterized protein n=1 Tax=Neocallimastix californiae TaxID=1754190 RepID=A0A1Y2DMD5_9FUNG|nr:hypothetical protein LY90DRAFT_668712 [Neocallimastix californiae]|eukprot:ORY60309.1 hypothetical protein LY90DRAFT_668712 [Neocallimastix californiae]